MPIMSTLRRRLAALPLASPAVVTSGLIAALSPAPASAQLAPFTTIADSETIVPGSGGAFASFGAPALDGGLVAFFGPGRG